MTHLTALFALLLLLCISGIAHAGLADYTIVPDTDIVPCVPPCMRVGNCGTEETDPRYPKDKNFHSTGPCNATVLAQICDSYCWCLSFNMNGWIKGCGNESCGGYKAGGAGIDSYVKNGGNLPPPPASFPDPIDDVHYPPEEDKERQTAAPVLISADANSAIMADPADLTNQIKVAIGSEAFGFVLMATMWQQADKAAVVERTFARWGFLAYITVNNGEVARLRKARAKYTTWTCPTSTC